MSGRDVVEEIIVVVTSSLMTRLFEVTDFVLKIPKKKAKPK
jgi:hypothetical protein